MFNIFTLKSPPFAALFSAAFLTVFLVSPNVLGQDNNPSSANESYELTQWNHYEKLWEKVRPTAVERRREQIPAHLKSNKEKIEWILNNADQLDIPLVFRRPGFLADLCQIKEKQKVYEIFFDLRIQGRVSDDQTRPFTKDGRHDEANRRLQEKLNTLTSYDALVKEAAQWHIQSSLFQGGRHGFISVLARLAKKKQITRESYLYLKETKTSNVNKKRTVRVKTLIMNFIENEAQSNRTYRSLASKHSAESDTLFGAFLNEHGNKLTRGFLPSTFREHIRNLLAKGELSDNAKTFIENTRNPFRFGEKN